MLVKSAYLKAAALDAASSASSAVATLNESRRKDGECLLDASHSKKQESEADTYSYDFMKANKYDVVGAYTAFKKLALLSEGSTQTNFEKCSTLIPTATKEQNLSKRKQRKKVYGKIREL